MNSVTIRRAFDEGIMSSKEAMTHIGEALKASRSAKDTTNLLNLSSYILDKEVPLTERDAEAEKIYSSRIYGDE